MTYGRALASQWLRLLGWAVLLVVSAPYAIKYLKMYYQEMAVMR